MNPALVMTVAASSVFIKDVAQQYKLQRFPTNYQAFLRWKLKVTQQIKQWNESVDPIEVW